jgi:biopolymer transport protein ExbD
MSAILKRNGRDNDHELQMTPMIDVTFLLLIFFLCSIKFKVLDGKLSTYLPKDVGVNVSMMDRKEDLERMEVRLGLDHRTRHGFSLEMNGIKYSDLRSFFAKARWFAERAPEMRAAIHTGEGIEHDHVVKTVNELLRAGLTQITFVDG